MSEEQKQDLRGEVRKKYESSELVENVKKQLDNILLALLPAAQEEYKHSELITLVRKGISVADLVAKYPATRIADELANTIIMVGGLEKRLNDAERMAYTDFLTGIANRRKLEDELERELKYVGTTKTPRLSYIMFDIDNFKDLNDKHGHDAGDYVLIQIGEILNKFPQLTKARYGGEEFVVLARNYAEMPEHLKISASAQSKIETGEQIAERLRKAIENHKFIFESKDELIPLNVTASFGVAGYDKGGYTYFDHRRGKSIKKVADTAKQLHKRADDALYDAKDDGRNRTKAYFNAERAAKPREGKVLTFNERVLDAYAVLKGIKRAI